MAGWISMGARREVLSAVAEALPLGGAEGEGAHSRRAVREPMRNVPPGIAIMSWVVVECSTVVRTCIIHPTYRLRGRKIVHGTFRDANPNFVMHK